MAWLGSRVIVAEYFAGIVLPLGLGAFTLRSIYPFHWSKLFGVWLITIAANYIPLFIYAVIISRSGTAATEGQPEIEHARRYGFQQPDDFGAFHGGHRRAYPGTTKKSEPGMICSHRVSTSITDLLTVNCFFQLSRHHPPAVQHL